MNISLLFAQKMPDNETEEGSTKSKGVFLLQEKVDGNKKIKDLLHQSHISFIKRREGGQNQGQQVD